MNLKSQVQSQYSYAMSHKGKAIGSTLGIIAGVSYGLAGKKSTWAVAGLTIAGAVGGAILGGLFDKQPTIVIPVTSDGTKAPVVADTVGEETANDTAGDDGMMNAIGDDGRVPCTNPTSLIRRGNPNDPCCTGTANCRGGVIKTATVRTIKRGR